MGQQEIFVYPSNGALEPVTPTIGFAAVGLAHGHIYSMCDGLIRAGAELKYVYEPEATLLEPFCKQFAGVQVCSSVEEILEKQDIQLIASADIPSYRADLGIRAMKAGKDFFVDKAPMTTLEQVDAVRKVCAETGKKYFVYYSESLCDASAVYARDLIRRGVIGKVLHVDGVAPHRHNPPSRAPWFYTRELTGGILTDIVCHQIHQFLEFTDAGNARVDMGRASNRCHPQYPGWDDFGDCACTADNGATGHFRVDWFTPDGLSSWGDGRMLIVGTEGFIELRKNCNIAQGDGGRHVYVVTQEGEFHDKVENKVTVDFYHRVLRDCLNRTETAVAQERAFQAITLAIQAQNMALENR